MDLSDSPEKSDSTNLWPEKGEGPVARVPGAQSEMRRIPYVFAHFSIVLG